MRNFGMALQYSELRQVAHSIHTSPERRRLAHGFADDLKRNESIDFDDSRRQNLYVDGSEYHIYDGFPPIIEGMSDLRSKLRSIRMWQRSTGIGPYFNDSEEGFEAPTIRTANYAYMYREVGFGGRRWEFYVQNENGECDLGAFDDPMMCEAACDKAKAKLGVDLKTIVMWDVKQAG